MRSAPWLGAACPRLFNKRHLRLTLFGVCLICRLSCGAPFQALRFASSPLTICSSDWVPPTLRSCSWRSVAERDCLRQQVLLAALLGQCGGAASIVQLDCAIWLLAQGQQSAVLVARSATGCKSVNSWVFTALMASHAAVHKSRCGFFCVP